jgi:hypothetical protein
MRVRIPRTLLVAAAALALGSVAYAQEINVRARIPFDFVAGNNVYSAGDYALRTARDTGFFMSINNQSQTTPGLIDSFPCTLSKPVTPGDQAKLVFHRIGNTYFLYRVWVGGETTGRELLKSHRETQMAMNGSTTETVIVATNITH